MLPFLGLQLNGAWYMAVPLVIAGTLAFLAIGLLVGSVAKTAEGGSGLANLITLPMAFLSGAFIPLESAPAWLRRGVEVPADGLPGGGHEGRHGARRRAVGRRHADPDHVGVRGRHHVHRDQGVPLGRRA